MNDLSQFDSISVETAENYRQLFEMASRMEIQYPQNTFEGRGIVICGGGPKLFPSTWASVNLLRRHGCMLPIEIWYLGEGEMPKEFREMLARIPGQVRLVDGRRHPRASESTTGWQLKSLAILYSSFEEVLSLDADNIAVANPEYLFESEGFKTHGATFWPDYGRFHRSLPIWDILGIEYRDELEFESGQILVDKKKCWKALNLALHLNIHAKYYYRFIYGDKDTFRMAWHKCGLKFSMPPFQIFSLNATMCQHDFEGRRIFQHRNRAKLRVVPPNEVISGFLFEKECCRFIEDLFPVWEELELNPRYWNPKGRSTLELEFCRTLTSTQWVYNRVSFDSRPMSFCSDGSIDVGAAGGELTWDLSVRESQIFLHIYGESFETCRLVWVGDMWIGKWRVSEQPAILLFEAGFCESLDTETNINASQALPFSGLQENSVYGAA